MELYQCVAGSLKEGTFTLCEALKWEKIYCTFDFFLHDFELQIAFQ